MSTQVYAPVQYHIISCKQYTATSEQQTIYSGLVVCSCFKNQPKNKVVWSESVRERRKWYQHISKIKSSHSSPISDSEIIDQQRSRAKNSEGGDVPQKYFVVTNNQLLRVKYLLVYSQRRHLSR